MSRERLELTDNELEAVNGGDIGFDPQPDGTYKMKTRYTKLSFFGISAEQKMKIDIYAATQPCSEAGETNIVNWCREQGYID